LSQKDCETIQNIVETQKLSPINMGDVAESQILRNDKKLDEDADSKMYSTPDIQLKKNEESEDIDAL